MQQVGINTITGIDNTGPIIDSDCEFSSSYHMVLPKGTTAQRPSNVLAGSIRYNTETKSVEQYNGTSWTALNSYTPGRGVFAGGLNGPTAYNVIDYITISTTGSIADFGDLVVTRWTHGACASSTRGFFVAGRRNASPIIQYEEIDYITFANIGNSTVFASLSIEPTDYYAASCSSSTRGLRGGGYYLPVAGYINTIEYFNLQSEGGSSASFGILSNSIGDHTACASSTRGIWGGGTRNGGSITNLIEFVTISSLGNAGYFGDLVFSVSYVTSCSSFVRGVFAGGYRSTPINDNISTISYINIPSSGNSVSYGNLSTSRNALASCSSLSRGVFAGGASGNPGTTTSAIEYLTIASGGSTTTFGSVLSNAKQQFNGCSDSHGGLA